MRRALPAALLCTFVGCQCGPALFGAEHGTLWVSSSVSGRVVVLDAADGGQVGFVDLPGANGRGAAVTTSSDGERVFVANEGAGAVSILGVRALKVDGTVTGLLRPLDLRPSASGQFLYVAQGGSNEIAVVDTSAQSFVRVAASAPGVSSRTQSVWAAAAGSVYVANQLSSTLAAVDVPGGPVRWSMPVVQGPTRVVAKRNGDVGYVTGNLDGVVQQILLTGNDSPDAGTITPVGSNPVWLSLSQDDRWLVVSNGEVANTISVLDLPQGFYEQGKVVVGGGNLGHNALSPTDPIAYVAVGLPPSIAVVNLEQQSVIATYPLQESPRGLAFLPRLDRR